MSTTPRRTGITLGAALMPLLEVLACGDVAVDRPAGSRTVRPLAVDPWLPVDARTREDRERRLRITLPPGWHRASERATERVSLVAGPVLAVGTSPVRPRAAAACSDAPDEPRIDLGPADALIVVEEDPRARAELARERPRFRLLEQVAPPGKPGRRRTGVFPAWACRNEVGIVGLRAPSFADGGRVFSVTAIVGRAATRRTRREVLGILESLEPITR